MDEMSELRASLLGELMLELAPYTPAVCRDFVKTTLDRALLKVIHKAYTLGGKECLKIIKG